MKYSQLFTKTSKDISSEEVSKNAQLLIRAGFVDKTMAGVYAYLPLGLRVLDKIENIVRKHLNRIGGQEVLMNTLHTNEWWESTGRLDTVDILFKLESQTQNQYVVACSHEEQITPIAKKFISSYKDIPIFDPEKNTFPLSIYQVQTKFRDELRAKSGLLRGREFRMKDMYDFHQTQASLDNYYELVKQTYFAIYEELGLEVYAIVSDGGDFTDNLSHEFQTPCSAGEDIALVSKSTGFAINQEVLEEYKAGGKEIPTDLVEVKVAEVGNIFKLGDKYTKAFDLKYTTPENEQKYPVMGCHGIGVSRCMAVIAENWSDEKGLVWPESVSPFKYHLITHINPNDEVEVNAQIQDLAERVYKGLVVLERDTENLVLRDLTKFVDSSISIDVSKYIKTAENVFWDDRDGVSIGAKLKDADLMGMPYQLIISKRSLGNGGIEVIKRSTGESQILAVA